MVKLIFKGKKTMKRRPSIVFSQPSSVPLMKMFDQIRGKAWQISDSMSPGDYNIEDYADFEGVAPGSHVPRGAAAAEAKPARGLNPASRGVKF